MNKPYEVKDISLASQGLLNLEVAERNMAALLRVKARFEKERPFKGLRIGMALHVTKETGVLVRTLVAGGAEVAITGCNPLSTQDDTAAALAKEGIRVYAYKGETHTDYYRYLGRVIEFRPHITIDDGCDLVTEIHTKHAGLIPDIIGGCEETTTGVIRLKAMEKDGALKYPMIAVNDNKTKHLMDNYYGTGQSTIDGLLRASNMLFAGKTVVVCGYGSCGKGVAMRAHGLGSNVVICEVDAFRALQAVMDGYRVLPMIEACELGDVFITVTGNKNVITVPHVRKMKRGAILANSGHFDAEIDVEGMRKAAESVRRVRPYFDEYVFGGRDGEGSGRVGRGDDEGRGKQGGRADTSGAHFVYLAGEGRLVNLAVAEGHPSEVMSLSFCGQALACEYLVQRRGKLTVAVHSLPSEIDDYIAGLQLTAMGIRKDSLTGEQEKYLRTWEEGT